MEATRKNKPKCTNIALPDNMPNSVVGLARLLQVHETYTQDENIVKFINSLNLSDFQIKLIEEATRSQSSSDEWFKQREGRITASNFHRVYTRMETLKKNPNENINNLTQLLIHKDWFETFATRHGIATEPQAKSELITVLKEKGHKIINTRECGTVVSKEYPYLSASPDLIIECQCCGVTLAEIKCPYSIRDEKPSSGNLKQLQETDNGISLKTNHAHYHQIQGQLGVTNNSQSWYFVFTNHGYYIEKIAFDKKFFEMMLTNLKTFWFHHLSKELIFSKTDTNPSSSHSTFLSLENSCDRKQDPLVSSKVIELSKIRQKALTSKMKYQKKIKLTQPIFLCKECHEEVPYNPKVSQDNSINCDVCDMWFHFRCVNISDEQKIPDENDSWICGDCQLTL